MNANLHCSFDTLIIYYYVNLHSVGLVKLLVLQKIESPGLDGRCWDYAERVGTA